MTSEEIDAEIKYRVTERLGISFAANVVTPAQAFAVKTEIVRDVEQLTKTQHEFSL